MRQDLSKSVKDPPYHRYSGIHNIQSMFCPTAESSNKYQDSIVYVKYLDPSNVYVPTSYPDLNRQRR